MIAWVLAAAGLPVLAGTCHVSVNGVAYSPATLAINVGDTVVWENTEAGFPHTTTSDLSVANTNYWNGVLGQQGGTFAHTFNQAGTFTYHDQLDFGSGLISVGAPGNSAVRLQSPRVEKGQFLFEATGLTVGSTNVLQFSTDLTTWGTIRNNVATSSTMTFTNAAPTPHSFFRLASLAQPLPPDIPYQWECQSPFPVWQNLYGVCALATNSAWAVGGSDHGGADGAIVYYDSTGWTVQADGLANALFGVCAVATNSAWAVGARGTILHYDGHRWRPQNSGTAQWLYGVTALNASNVWAVGFGGTILHYDGTNWGPQASGTAWRLRAVSAADAANVWAVGDQGTLLQYDGRSWSPQDSGSTAHLLGVSARTATDVWAVGRQSAVLHYQGTVWRPQPATTAPDETFTGVIALEGGAVWVTTTTLATLCFDGTQWRQLGYPFLCFNAVAAVDANHVWLVGKLGSIASFNGAVGTRHDHRANGLLALSASTVDHAWAVGKSGAATRYDGTNWNAQTSGTSRSLYGVTTLDATHAWAVGDASTILYHDGLAWSPQRIATLQSQVRLRAVSALDPVHVWAVGEGGTILQFKGQEWVPQESGTARLLYAVSARSPQNVWAVGEAGTILHYDGTSWNAQNSGTPFALYGVSAVDDHNVWAVGCFGTVLHWDGTRWNAQVSGTTKALYGVSALNPGNVWAAGAEGTILHWDGARWSNNRSGYGKQDWFWGVCAVNTNHVWAVGFDEQDTSGLIRQGRPGGKVAALEEPAAPRPNPWVPTGGSVPARVDLSGELPPVGNQTDIFPGAQSCGPWSIGYYQLTQWIKHFRRPDWDLTQPQNWMSPAFVYRLGSDMAAFSVLKDKGCTDLLDMPYHPFDMPDPTPDQLEAAKPFRITGYLTLWNRRGTTPPYYPDNNLELAKTWLAQGYVLSSGVYSEAGDFPDAYNTPPATFYDPPGKPKGANHWVALCGYDDNINPAATDPDHRGGFLLVNCWGDHWNGDMHGFLWISYAWVKNYLESAYALLGDGPSGPVIAGCDPILAAAGDTVTITGRDFGALRRQAWVSLNGTPAEVVSFANESITVIVPQEATSGPLRVFDWEGTPSDSIYFMVVPKDGGQ